MGGRSVDGSGTYAPIRRQGNKLLNQHIGTGYIIVKTNDDTIRIADIALGKNGNWYVGLNSEPLDVAMRRIAGDIAI